jgi:hypothetical protein
MLRELADTASVTAAHKDARLQGAPSAARKAHA